MNHACEPSPPPLSLSRFRFSLRRQRVGACVRKEVRYRQGLGFNNVQLAAGILALFESSCLTQGDRAFQTPCLRKALFLDTTL